MLVRRLRGGAGYLQRDGDRGTIPTMRLSGRHRQSPLMEARLSSQRVVKVRNGIFNYLSSLRVTLLDKQLLQMLLKCNIEEKIRATRLQLIPSGLRGIAVNLFSR